MRKKTCTPLRGTLALAHALRSDQNNAKYYGRFGAGERTPLGPIKFLQAHKFLAYDRLTFYSTGLDLVFHHIW